ncbi:uncharacterized protein LOC130635758 isoform X1 [Hydractinia symbiolongicarpus]|uniref:uncharacterized protein LOC130635749 isoform X1 n=1 Tax=Hydractinia symbiolongicarpus TaxID=13093 RepID=UPI00254EB716|nr:uncharacterized protein LOC130635749 isoform X1 [Hydractinia symbiolongicarpus]XP_057301201.1 uncharacterized protein LOC130635758 isoform X1 [Hydractinia symbiolongicarpus]
MTALDGVKKKYLYICLTLLVMLKTAMSGSVEAITRNKETLVNTTAELSWRVESNQPKETLFGVQLYEAGVVVIDDKSGTVTEAGKREFGGRLSASFLNGIYKMFIKKIRYNEVKSFTLLAVFSMASGVTRENDTATITNVKGGPIFCGANISKSYNVIEGKALTLQQDVCGNPQPNVQWKMSSDSTYMPTESYVLIENMTKTYRNTFTTKALTRTKCGHIVDFRAFGSNGKVIGQTMININFTPAVATAIAYYHQDNCVHVNWKTEDTGNCKVTYQLTFNTANTFEVTGNTFKNCSQVILRTTSVNIRGIYKNQRGDKSEDVFSSTIPPCPPHKI